MSFRSTAASVIDGIESDKFDLGPFDWRQADIDSPWSDPNSIQDTLLRFAVNFESHQNLQEGAVQMPPTPPLPLFASLEWQDYRNEVKNFEKAFLFIDLCLEKLEQLTAGDDAVRNTHFDLVRADYGQHDHDDDHHHRHDHDDDHHHRHDDESD